MRLVEEGLGLERPKPTAELYGPVVLDSSDPLSLGADGQSNNTGELQAMAKVLLWSDINIILP